MTIKNNKNHLVIHEYAKAEAVAFGEWLRKNASPIVPNKNEWLYFKIEAIYTTSELYQEFKKQTK